MIALVFITTSLVNNTPIEEGNNSSKNALKTTLNNYVFSVGFIHKGVFYAVGEDQLLRFFSAQNDDKVNFSELMIKIDSEVGAVFSTQPTSLKNKKTLVSMSMYFDLDQENERLVMSGVVCSCASTSRDASEGVANAMKGGCECSPSSVKCTKTSTAVTSEYLYSFFVANK